MYVVLVSRWWKDRGHRVAVVTLRNSPIAVEGRKYGIEVIEASRSGYVQPSAVRAVLKGVSTFRPDVIHVNLSKDLWCVAISQLFAKKVAVVFSQQMASDYPKRDPLHRLVWSKVDRVVTNTSQIKEMTLKNACIREDKILVAPHGVDTERLKPSITQRQELRARHAIQDNQFVIGVVGRLDPKKGQSVFLDALSRLDEDSDVLGFLIGEETKGESGYRKTLEDRVAALRLQHRVKFLGFVKDPGDYYPMLDLLVLPSKKETFGMVLVEAMAFALPVVATNAGGVPEIVVDDVTGILVPPDDPEALARAISQILSDREMSAKMGKEGRRRAIEHYQIATHIDLLESTLYQAAGK